MTSSKYFVFYLIVLKLVANPGVIAEVRFTSDGHPSNVTVFQGETFELACSVTGLPHGRENEYVAHWLSKTGFIEESSVRRFATICRPVPGDSSLVTAVYSFNVTRAKDTDQGFYRCLLYHDKRSFLTSEKAFVGVIPRPPFRRQPLDQTVVEGQNVTLGCTLESYTGAYIVKWFRRGHIISEDHTIFKTNESYYDSLTIQGKNGSGIFDLHISNVSREISGKFQCKVFTAGYKKPTLRSHTARIIVRYPPEMLYPKCNSSNINNSFVEGEVIEAMCWAQGGNSPVYFEWTKDGKTDNGTLEELYSLYVGKMRWSLTAQDDGKYISCAMKGFAILNDRQCTIGPIYIQSTQLSTFVSTDGYSKTSEALAGGTKMTTWPSTNFITDKRGPTQHSPPSHTTNNEFKAVPPSAFTSSVAKGSLIPLPPVDKLGSRIMYATIALAIILMAVVAAVVVLYVDSRKTDTQQSAFKATIDEENQGQAKPANNSQNDTVDTNPTEEPSEKSEENREESV